MSKTKSKTVAPDDWELRKQILREMRYYPRMDQPYMVFWKGRAYSGTDTKAVCDAALLGGRFDP